MQDIVKPTLTETNVKQYISNVLKNCKEYKIKYYNIVINIGLLVLFIVLLLGVLIYKYKGKLTPEEKKKKDNEKYMYILSKIKNFQDAKRLAHQQLITGLPGWENDYDAIVRR